MAYSKQTWDTNSYVNPTRMNHIEDGIADTDLTAGGSIVKPNTTSTTNDSRLYLGNNIPNGTTGSSRGVLSIYDKNQYNVTILAGDNRLTEDRFLVIPDTNGFLTTSSSETITEFGTFELTYNNQQILLTGFKTTILANGRYTIIGSVLGGANQGGNAFIYNSWSNTFIRLT